MPLILTFYLHDISIVTEGVACGAESSQDHNDSHELSMHVARNVMR